MPAIPGATQTDVRSLPNSGHDGKYVLRGVVTKQDGTPAEGAAIIVGRDTVYTDSQGRFSVRERKCQRYVVKVDLENFMGSEHWRVKSVEQGS